MGVGSRSSARMWYVGTSSRRSRPGAVNIGLIDLMARHSLNNGLHVVIEGILYADRYGDMLTHLLRDHPGVVHCYYFDLPFEVTPARHATKPVANEYGETELRQWWRPRDLLPNGVEKIIDQHSSLEQSVTRVLSDSGLAAKEPPQLITPSVQVHHSYAKAVREYQGEGSFPDFNGLDLTSRQAMEEHVAQVRAQWGGPDRYLWWYVRGATYLGRISLRRHSSDRGQLGFDIRPSHRGQGHATRVVGALSLLADTLGFGAVQSRVRQEHRASRRVHETNNAVVAEEGDGWVTYTLPVPNLP